MKKMIKKIKKGKLRLLLFIHFLVQISQKKTDYRTVEVPIYVIFMEITRINSSNMTQKFYNKGFLLKKIQ
jgi:hypothetical protein